MRQWTKDEMRGRYVVELNVEGQKFIGEADLPQSAKHNAAIQVSLWILKNVTCLKRVCIMNVNIVCADRCNCWENGTGKEKKI